MRIDRPEPTSMPGPGERRDGLPVQMPIPGGGTDYAATALPEAHIRGIRSPSLALAAAVVAVGMAIGLGIAASRHVLTEASRRDRLEQRIRDLEQIVIEAATWQLLHNCRPVQW